MNDRKYYLVPEDSPVMANIRRAQEQLREFKTAAVELQREFGATQLAMAQGITVGLFFKGAPPAGWKRKAGAQYCAPILGIKRGRANAERLAEVPKDPRHPLVLSEMVGFAHYDRAAGKAHFPGVYEFDGQTVLSMHVDCAEEPEGCMPLTTAEYVAMKEAAEKREVAA